MAGVMRHHSRVFYPARHVGSYTYRQRSCDTGRISVFRRETDGISRQDTYAAPRLRNLRAPDLFHFQIFSRQATTKHNMVISLSRDRATNNTTTSTDLHAKSAAATQQQATREKTWLRVGLFTQTPTQVKRHENAQRHDNFLCHGRRMVC
jgi:hypothetical protein